MNSRKTTTKTTFFSLYQSLEGICTAQGDLDAKKTFLDSLIWCATEECVNFASDLLAKGDIQDDMIDGWLFSFSLNPNPTPGMAQMVAKALSGATGSQRERGNLALGALIHRTCREIPNQCAGHASIKEALKVSHLDRRHLDTAATP